MRLHTIKTTLRENKPRIYKKNLMVGNRRIFRFTKAYAYTFFQKVMLMLIIILILITMFFSGVVLILNGSTPTTVTP